MAGRTSNVIRRKFIEHFTNKYGHRFVESSSVKPPHDDTSLTFVNAGMNQFKPLFLADQSNYELKRVCNYQKCIRAGGKMCDLDDIGRDFRHLSFFEMLGNWSFNDYYKPEACEWALEFLVNALGLDQSKMSVTYFSGLNDEDMETKKIWQRLGFRDNQIVANNTGDNFWEMGNSGPCGQSTEIFYPLNGELVELWNLVFIDRQRLNESGEIVKLQNRFVDTGMGLERLITIVENVKSVYETDLFEDSITAIERKSNVKRYGARLDDDLDINYRILSDHCRMITIALADGMKPGRERGPYILRSIIKKCLLISRDVFGQEKPRLLIFDLVDQTTDSLSLAYPYLPSAVKHIRRTLARESKRYLSYLEKRIEDDPNN